MYDRETGKPKGYGFCEYQDLETAQSAMRNLNNHDFNGRPLRVGVAAGEQSKDENRGMQQALGGPAAEVMLDIGYVSFLNYISLYHWFACMSTNSSNYVDDDSNDKIIMQTL